MRVKRDIIDQTPLFKDALEGLQVGEDEEEVLLRSKQYIAVGCDLCQLASLENTLKEAANLRHSPILFIAEVSLTYMNHQDADAMIQWASNIDHGKPFLQVH